MKESVWTERTRNSETEFLTTHEIRQWADFLEVVSANGLHGWAEARLMLRGRVSCRWSLKDSQRLGAFAEDAEVVFVGEDAVARCAGEFVHNTELGQDAQCGVGGGF